MRLLLPLSSFEDCKESAKDFLFGSLGFCALSLTFGKPFGVLRDDLASEGEDFGLGLLLCESVLCRLDSCCFLLHVECEEEDRAGDGGAGDGDEQVDDVDKINGIEGAQIMSSGSGDGKMFA